MDRGFSSSWLFFPPHYSKYRPSSLESWICTQFNLRFKSHQLLSRHLLISLDRGSVWATQGPYGPAHLTAEPQLRGKKNPKRSFFLFSFKMEYLTLWGGILHSLSNTRITGLLAGVFQRGRCTIPWTDIALLSQTHPALAPLPTAILLSPSHQQGCCPTQLEEALFTLNSECPLGTMWVVLLSCISGSPVCCIETSSVTPPGQKASYKNHCD